MQHYKSVILISSLFLSILLTFSSSVHAEIVTHRMPNGKTALARFNAGEPDKPAVIMLHGFLTTNNFNTILSATEMLAENKITVLAPTLTLGINKRSGGLACDAIHTHTIDEDVGEVHQWVKWLDKKGYHNIILIGHSQGSLSLVAYVARQPHPSIKKIVAASLSYIDAFTPSAHQVKQILQAKKLVAAKDNQPTPFSLAYCQGNFVTPAKIYLDYAIWDQSKVIEAINKSPVPVVVIMGTADTHFGIEWQKRLKEDSPATLHLVKGAKHFMDGTSEFDFHDLLLNELN